MCLVKEVDIIYTTEIFSCGLPANKRATKEMAIKAIAMLSRKNLTDAKKNVDATTSLEIWPFKIRSIKMFSNTSKKPAIMIA